MLMERNKKGENQSSESRKGVSVKREKCPPVRGDKGVIGAGHQRDIC